MDGGGAEGEVREEAAIDGRDRDTKGRPRTAADGDEKAAIHGYRLRYKRIK